MYVGMPIFISNNIATELGITNGTKGVVKAIHLQNGKSISEEDTGFHLPEFKDMDYVIAELEDVTVTPL